MDRKYYVIKFGKTIAIYEDFNKAMQKATEIDGKVADYEVPYEKKESILENIGIVQPTTARNSMGCNESWYNSYYAMSKVFSPEELEAMSEEELNHLLRLGDAISEALY